MASRVCLVLPRLNNDCDESLFKWHHLALLFLDSCSLWCTSLHNQLWNMLLRVGINKLWCCRWILAPLDRIATFLIYDICCLSRRISKIKTSYSQMGYEKCCQGKKNAYVYRILVYDWRAGWNIDRF